MFLTTNQKHDNYKTNDIGIIFISPIIGLPSSLMSTFDSFKEIGVGIKGVDIWEGQNSKKKLLRVLQLTILPGSNKKRIEFANAYDESILFKIIFLKIKEFLNEGKNKIVLGGMSGGFIFASRIAQIPLDNEISELAREYQPFIKGIFGISPLIFYPKGVTRINANLELLPKNIITMLIWGDNDSIVPKDTISYAKKISINNNTIICKVINGLDVGLKEKNVRHQFYGGKDFIKPFKNIFWNKNAELAAKNLLLNFLEQIKTKSYE